jgi:transcriptional regulator with XRE-family HTH domain
MQAQHKVRRMVGSEELNKKAEEIGERIRQIMADRKLDHKKVGDLYGTTPNAVTKMLGGNSTMQWAKLAKLAPALGTDPNDILGFGKGSERALFRGALKGIAQALGRSDEEAYQIALIALEVLDRRSSGVNQEESARSVAEFLIRQFVDLKR